MPLDDPVVIYHSANHMYAVLVQIYLAGEGIEAIATDNGSVKHRAGQVWTSRNDAAKALTALKEYLERMQAKADDLSSHADEPIEVICEECGKSSVFHSSYLGSVEECAHCLSYLDVGSVDEAWWEEAESQQREEE